MAYICLYLHIYIYLFKVRYYILLGIPHQNIISIHGMTTFTTPFLPTVLFTYLNRSSLIFLGSEEEILHYRTLSGSPLGYV
jgi:hypothetical protein